MDEVSSEGTTRHVRAPQRFGAARFVRLARKELRETLRDRRTIVTLVLMPVLLYPLLGVALQQFMLTSASGSADVAWRIAVESSEQREQLDLLLTQGSMLLADDRRAPALPPLETAASTLPAPEANSPRIDNLRRIEAVVTSDAEQRVRVDADLGVRLQQENGEPNSPVAFEIFFRPQSAHSRAAAEHVEQRLRAVNEAVVRARLREAGQSARRPLQWQWRAIVDPAASGPTSLASLAPLVLILMTITGAVYPAIDLTAGERERGTLEALMAAPVPRLSLLGAKYIAVLTVALLTALANLLAMSITLQGTGIGAALLGDDGFSLRVVGVLFLLLALFAAFFSAVLLAITCFARSFKEAQAYLIPLMLVALGPGFLSVIPGLELDWVMAVVPLANMVLLARDVMQGSVAPVPAAIAVVATAVYALIALLVAARIFGSDAVLYGSQASWSDALRRPDEQRRRMSLSAAWLTAAVVYPLYFVTQIRVSGLQGSGPVVQLVSAAIGTVAVFAVVPLLVVLWQRVWVRGAFQIRGASWLAFVGAAILGVSLWPLAHEVFLLAQQAGLGTIDASQLERLVPQVGEMLAKLRQVSPVLVLLCLAAVPAVCEELFFRGLLLGSMRGRVPAWIAIGTTAALFGLFHLSVGGLSAFERVITTTFLGLALGAICWRTGSVLPGIVTHMLHNGLLLSLAYWQERFTGAGGLEAGGGHLPWTWLALSATGVLLGGVLAFVGGRQPTRNEQKGEELATDEHG